MLFQFYLFQKLDNNVQFDPTSTFDDKLPMVLSDFDAEDSLAECTIANMQNNPTIPLSILCNLLKSTLLKFS